MSTVPVHPTFGPQQDEPNDGKEDDDMEELEEHHNEGYGMEEELDDHHDIEEE